MVLAIQAEDVKASNSTWRACTRLMSWLLEVAGAFPGCIQSMWSPLAVLSVNSRDCAAAEWAASWNLPASGMHVRNAYTPIVRLTYANIMRVRRA